MTRNIRIAIRSVDRVVSETLEQKKKMSRGGGGDDDDDDGDDAPPSPTLFFPTLLPHHVG